MLIRHLANRPTDSTITFFPGDPLRQSVEAIGNVRERVRHEAELRHQDHPLRRKALLQSWTLGRGGHYSGSGASVTKTFALRQ